MKGAKGLYLGRTTPSSPQSLSFNDAAVAMKTVGAKGPYWPEVVAVGTQRSEVRTKRPRANISRYGSS